MKEFEKTKSDILLEINNIKDNIKDNLKDSDKKQCFLDLIDVSEQAITKTTNVFNLAIVIRCFYIQYNIIQSQPMPPFQSGAVFIKTNSDERD